MKKIKSTKGITLIALVITIIILLILAGITIGILKNSKLLNNAEITKEKYDVAQNHEKEILNEYNQYLIQDDNGEIVSSRDNISKIISNFAIKKNESTGTKVAIDLDGDISTNDGSDILVYIIVVNGVGIDSTKTLPYEAKLEKNFDYKIEVVAIDKEINLKKSSNNVNGKTPNIIVQPLEYPILKTTGMINVKYINAENTNDFTYGLEKTVNCTGTNALRKEAYDGDETTYVNAGNDTRFIFGDDNFYPGYFCILSSSGPSYSNWKGSSWAGNSGDFSKYSNGYYWMSYYGYPGNWNPNSSNGICITGGGNIYEVTSIIR